jgi:acetate kinase
MFREVTKNIDPEKNDTMKALPADLSTPGSRILAVATNEEMAIARFSHGLLLNSQSERIAL